MKRPVFMGDSGYDPGEPSDNRCDMWPVGCLSGICSYSLLSWKLCLISAFSSMVECLSGSPECGTKAF